MTEFITESVDETKERASEIAKTLKEGSVIGFLGDLGAGKTAFTSGFVKGLGIDCDVSSPTFSICNEYTGNGKKVCHYDMYRVDNWDDLYSTGFFDVIDTNAYILAEWSENIFGALPDEALIIRIEKLDENKRKFTLMSKTEV